MLRVIYNKQRHGRKSGGNHEPLKYSEEIIVVEVPAWKCGFRNVATWTGTRIKIRKRYQLSMKSK